MPDDLGIVTEAVAIEDRGDLGVGGEQLAALRYHVEGCDEDFETERAVSELTEPPTRHTATSGGGGSRASGPSAEGAAGRRGRTSRRSGAAGSLQCEVAVSFSRGPGRV